jgi:hypothetical protein
VTIKAHANIPKIEGISKIYPIATAGPLIR